MCGTYWDLMIRCAPYCRPEFTQFDQNGDCIISDYELGVVIDNWLEQDLDLDIQPVEVSDANLILKYTFDADLTDSSGNAYHGVAVNDVSVHDG
ncbi:hypothetical protein ACFL1G_04970, partial [Planctomycetota bacterium]